MKTFLNNNMLSLLIQRNVQTINDDLALAMERLSTGKRINNAADDPAGLALSEGIQYRVRGLQQVSRNATTGNSILQIAEAGLETLTSLVLRIRELVTEAGNGTLNNENRQQIQEEINQLVTEVTRTSQTVEFNGRTLLDGTFRDQRVQVGTYSTRFITISFDDMRASALGAYSQITGDNIVSAGAIAGDGDLIINGEVIGISTSDSVSSVSSDTSALAKATAINAKTYLTNTSASAQTVLQVAGASIGGVVLDGTVNSLSINGHNIGATAVGADDSDGALRDAINAISTNTGVVATLSAGNELVLTASDGRNIEITTTGSVADEIGLAIADGDLIGDITRGRITLTGQTNVTVEGTNIGVIGFTAANTFAAIDNSRSMITINVLGGDPVADNLTKLDIAESQIGLLRTSIGSISNRLEAILTSITKQIDDLQSAEANITDADIAIESANLARAQIIQQTSIAMLAQANLIPKNVLSLLKIT